MPFRTSSPATLKKRTPSGQISMDTESLVMAGTIHLSRTESTETIRRAPSRVTERAAKPGSKGSRTTGTERTSVAWTLPLLWPPRPPQQLQPLYRSVLVAGFFHGERRSGRTRTLQLSIEEIEERECVPFDRDIEFGRGTFGKKNSRF